MGLQLFPTFLEENIGIHPSGSFRLRFQCMPLSRLILNNTLLYSPIDFFKFQIRILCPKRTGKLSLSNAGSTFLVLGKSSGKCRRKIWQHRIKTQEWYYTGSFDKKNHLPVLTRYEQHMLLSVIVLAFILSYFSPASSKPVSSPLTV